MESFETNSFDIYNPTYTFYSSFEDNISKLQINMINNNNSFTKSLHLSVLPSNKSTSSFN